MGLAPLEVKHVDTGDSELKEKSCSFGDDSLDIDWVCCCCDLIFIQRVQWLLGDFHSLKGSRAHAVCTALSCTHARLP